MSMKDQSGSTIVEFLIFTPIMVLLAFYATKISHQEKMKKHNLLTGRNMLFQGKVGIQGLDDPESAVSNFRDKNKHLTSAETLIMNIKEGISENNSLEQQEISKLESTVLKAPSVDANPEYIQYSDNVALFASALKKGNEKNRKIEESPLFGNSMTMRKSVLRLKKNGEADGFQKSIEHIQDFYAKKESSTNSTPDLVRRLYFRGDDLYHNQAGQKLAIPSLQLVNGTDKWASTNDSSQSNGFYQNYCQGKFTSYSKSCGDTDFLLLERPSFAIKIHELAEAKITLFNILNNAEIAPIQANLSAEWANQSAQFDNGWSEESTTAHKELVNTNGFIDPNLHVNLSYLKDNHHSSTNNTETFNNKLHEDINPVHKNVEDIYHVQ